MGRNAMMRILTCALMAAATFGAMPATAQEEAERHIHLGG